MRRQRLMALVAAVVALTLAQAPAASGSSREAVRADLVTHVFPEIGHRVVAVALRYDDPLQLRRGSAAARTAFSVTATIDGVTAPRTVTDVYSSPALPGDDWRGKGGTGRYLILELDPADANASVNTNSADGATAPRDLEGAYTITQTSRLRDDRGHTLAPPPFGLENDGIVQPVVDEFGRRSLTDAAGTRIAFRFFRPERLRHRRSYPLVLVLHGGGETGSPQVRPANVTQITANRSAIVWATPERQAEQPAFVVAPQLPGRTSQWTEPAIQAAVMTLIDRLDAAYPIDDDRIYLTGLSRGGRGAVEFLSNHPTTFAGSLLAAARAENDDVTQVPAFASVPLWLTHAVDDPVVPYRGSVDIANALEAAGARVTRGEWAGDNSAGRAQDRAAEAAARSLLGQARATRSHTLFTTYTAGTVAVNAHFSWGPMYETDVMLDWLFAQDRGQRRTR
jgi:predicted peptidase